MSKKALLFIPISQGGLMPDPVKEVDVPLNKELPKEFKKKRFKKFPKVHVLTSNQDLDNDGLADTIKYMTVSDYALYINRPVTVVYRLIKQNELESIKIKNKLHIILEPK